MPRIHTHPRYTRNTGWKERSTILTTIICSSIFAEWKEDFITKGKGNFKIFKNHEGDLSQITGIETTKRCYLLNMFEIM